MFGRSKLTEGINAITGSVTNEADRAKLIGQLIEALRIPNIIKAIHATSVSCFAEENLISQLIDKGEIDIPVNQRERKLSSVNPPIPPDSKWLEENGWSLVGFRTPVKGELFLSRRMYQISSDVDGIGDMDEYGTCRWVIKPLKGSEKAVA